MHAQSGRSPRGKYGRLKHLSGIPFAALTLALVFCAPYTKVEESFSLQAVHDVMLKMDVVVETLSYFRPKIPPRAEGPPAVAPPAIDDDFGDIEYEDEVQEARAPRRGSRGFYIFGGYGTAAGSNAERVRLRRFRLSIPGIFSFSIRQTRKFDHDEFPGVVPRTFVPSILLALIVRPVVWALNLAQAVVAFVSGGGRGGGAAPDLARLMASHARSGLYVQTTVRIILGLANIGALILFARSFARRLGSAAATIFLLLLSLQFHLPFYLSRTLPNTFASGVIWTALSLWMDRSDGACIAILAFAGLVLRCDTVLIAIPVGVSMIFFERVKLTKAIIIGAVSAATCLAVTVPLDSWFWGRWVWPEMEVMLFNTVQNRSGEWGTSPWHWYFTSALPRALMLAYPLAPMGAYVERRVRGYFVVACFYVVAYSFLPHKELRFVLPVLPLFTACAAPMVLRVWHNRRKSYVAALFSVAVYAGTLACSAAIVMFTAASVRNYPGGVSMTCLHALRDLVVQPARLVPGPAADPPSVHVGVLPAMSGVTQFLERPGVFTYSKEEGIPSTEMRGIGFDFLLSGDRSVDGYTCAAAVYQYAGIHFRPDTATDVASILLRMEPTVFIHQLTWHSKLPPVSKALAAAVEGDTQFWRQHFFVDVCR